MEQDNDFKIGVKSLLLTSPVYRNKKKTDRLRDRVFFWLPLLDAFRTAKWSELGPMMVQFTA